MLLLEQVLEDEWSPDAATRVHQQAALVKLSESDGGEPKSLRQVRDDIAFLIYVYNPHQFDDGSHILETRTTGFD